MTWATDNLHKCCCLCFHPPTSLIGVLPISDWLFKDVTGPSHRHVKADGTTYPDRCAISCGFVNVTGVYMRVMPHVSRGGEKRAFLQRRQSVLPASDYVCHSIANACVCCQHVHTHSGCAFKSSDLCGFFFFPADENDLFMYDSVCVLRACL